MAKEAGESANPITDVLSDTSPRAIDIVKSWTRCLIFWNTSL